MKPIKGKYVIKHNGIEVHGMILAFLGGYAEHLDVGVFMPDTSKGDFTRLKLIPVDDLYVQKT